MVLVLSFTMQSQTLVDLSNMNHNIVLGNDCSSSEQPDLFETTGNANFNGYKVTLRNSKLKINGNFNGPGTIEACGNSNSQICVTGITQNNPTLNGIEIVNCSVLSLPKYEYYEEDLPCKIYNITGQVIHEGSIKDKFELPKNKILIIRTSKYCRKIIVD